MGLLSRLLRRTASRKPTDHELAVARLILQGDDPRLGMLLRQLETTPSVTREHPDETSLRVSPTSTMADLNFPFEVMRLESDWTLVRDQSGRELEFRVVVVRSGFFAALEGRTADGTPWPRAWILDPATTVDPPHRLKLPSLEVFLEQQRVASEALTRWLGVPLPAGLDTFPPASAAQLAAREQTLGGAFPAGLRELFGITDGLESQELRLFGHGDIYTVPSLHLPALLLTWDSDNRDDFVVVVSLSGSDEQVYRLDVHVDDPRPEVIASDIRAYLAERLRQAGPRKP